jgi:ornithine cyclodeaminase
LTLLLRDDDVEQLLDLPASIAAVEEALRERARGAAASGARIVVASDGEGVVVSPGAFPGLGIVGLRAYPVRIDGRIDVVSMWSTEPPSLEALIVGSLFSPLRVGAIGGVAMQLLAEPKSSVLAVIGAGPQARMQAHAACAVLPIEEIRVFRRDAEGRAEAARAWGLELGVKVVSTQTAEEAVRDADVVVTATVADAPVLEAGWVEPQALVSVLGPTGTGASEVGLDLFGRAAFLVSDFPEQYLLDDDFMLHGTPHDSRIADLAQLVVEGRSRADGIAVFLSNGLTGAEIPVARELVRRAAGQGLGLELDVRAPRG